MRNLGLSSDLEEGFQSHLRTPFLRNGLGQAHDASLCQTVICLASVSVCAACARDIDDASLLTVFDSEIRCGLSDQPEGSSVVDCEDGIPLLVGDLVDHTVPCVAGIVDQDVNLAIAKLGRFGHQDGEVIGIGHITRDRDGPPR